MFFNLCPVIYQEINQAKKEILLSIEFSIAAYDFTLTFMFQVNAPNSEVICRTRAQNLRYPQKIPKCTRVKVDKI